MPDVISIVIGLIIVLFAIGGIATARHLRRRAEHRGQGPGSSLPEHGDDQI